MDPILRRSGRPLTVLIVEDQVLVAMDHARMVQEARGEVVGMVKSGEEAVEAARRLRPDVVLLDIRLAGRIDGFDAAEAITALPGVALIIVTANDDAATRKRASRFGAPVLDKPVLPSTLRRAVADVCGLAGSTISCARPIWQISVLPLRRARLYRANPRLVVFARRVPLAVNPAAGNLSGVIAKSILLRAEARTAVELIRARASALRAVRLASEAHRAVLRHAAGPETQWPAALCETAPGTNRGLLLQRQ